MARATKKIEGKTLEQKLWDAADALRGNQEPSEYKSVVLGLVFLKYVSDRFEARREDLSSELEADGLKPEQIERLIEDRDEYTKHNVFWVPISARWSVIQASAKQPEVGETIDKAMDLIEKENPKLKGVLPRDYGRAALDKGRLGQLVDIIASIGMTETDEHGSDDVLGRVYEYFLGQFAGKETGKDAGAFYTPRSVVKTLVEMLEPYAGRVYDPACGSGGMFVQSAEFVKAHGGKRDAISVFGQEFTDAAWRLAKMNLALRGIEADLGDRSADSFTQDLHPDVACRLRARESAVQRLELVGREARRRPALDLWRSTPGQRELCLGAALHLPPLAEGQRRLRPGERVVELEVERRGGDPPQAG